ncbi:MAG: hypothetical protein ACTSUE_09265 [Promethearchaeota archaeon]
MQESTDSNSNRDEGTQSFRSRRAREMPPDLFDPTKPRLGRRESEPHSAEITYLHDVLTTNFPEDRTMWDLHHYFRTNGIDFDIQFDVSFFKGMNIPFSLPSYRAERFNHKVPTMAINVLSKSTWKTDIGENVDYCQMLKIPLYIVFPAYHVATDFYRPPFVRAYILQDNGLYVVHELKELTINDRGEINPNAVIDTSSIVPFRLGLIQNEGKYNDKLPLYRLVLLKPDEITLLPSKLEREKARADQEKARADQEKARADQEKARAIQEKARADQEKARADQEKARANQEKARADVAEAELKRLREK